MKTPLRPTDEFLRARLMDLSTQLDRWYNHSMLDETVASPEAIWCNEGRKAVAVDAAKFIKTILLDAFKLDEAHRLTAIAQAQAVAERAAELAQTSKTFKRIG